MRVMPPAVQGAIRITGGGGRQQVEGVGTWIRDHARPGVPLHAEFMKTGRGSVNQALQGALAAGTPIGVLADDSQLKFGILGALEDAGAKVVVYGEDGKRSEFQQQYVQHGKGASTPTHALITTAHPSQSGKHQLNLSFAIEGEGAGAMHAATGAALLRNPREQARTIDEAQRRGVIYNDPEAERAHIDATYERLINGADRKLFVVMKEFLDPRRAEQIADRKVDGIDTEVLTREIDPKSASILKKAGIEQREVPFSGTPGLNSFFGRRLHFNAIFADVDGTDLAPSADGAAAVSSRYLWMPTKRDGSETLARELGLVVAGSDAQRTLNAVEDHVGRSHWDVIKGRILGT